MDGARPAAGGKGPPVRPSLLRPPGQFRPAAESRLQKLETEGKAIRPAFPDHVEHNAHTYWLLAPDLQRRDRVIADLRRQGIKAQFHYVPLHSAPAGLRYGRAGGDLSYTSDVSACLVRMPLWAGLEPEHARETAEIVIDALR